MDASLRLQRLLVAALEAHPPLRAAGVAVHDGPPADARPPFIGLGPDSMQPWAWKDGGGHEHRLTVSVWIGRDGMAGAKALMGEIEAAVLGMPRAGEGLRIVALRLLRSLVKRNPRSWTEGRLEFLARTIRE
ncbi:MAG: DUF3168 domain-containing protein [Thermaurantiacus tibetensis]|uniref:DUF3168 domain-containing protein n=1 Tax=Thermaurantiacus tibetensis TaxID=2759035 RepID=UPI0018901A5F|nr:DUF3168 domain-containing protein [Thermaurantiacus tibetensis]